MGNLSGFGELDYRRNPEKDYQAYSILWPGLNYAAAKWAQFSAGLRTMYTDHESSADTLESRPFVGVKLFLPKRELWARDMKRVMNEDGRNPYYRWFGEGGRAEEALAHQVAVEGFRTDQSPVTNEEFRRFVDNTKYATLAERLPNPEDYIRDSRRAKEMETARQL